MTHNPLGFALTEPAPWVADAACGVDSAPTMFPKPADQEGERRAKSVCALCPVRAQCLGTALRNGEQHGVWGGLTPDERNEMSAGARRRAESAAKRPVTVKTPSSGWIRGSRYTTISVPGGQV